MDNILLKSTLSRYNKYSDKGSTFEANQLLNIISCNKHFNNIFNDCICNMHKCANNLYSDLSFTLSNQINKEWFNLNPFMVKDNLTNDIIIGVRMCNNAADDGNGGVFKQKTQTLYDIFIIDSDMLTIKNIFPLNKLFNDKIFDRSVECPWWTGTEDYRVINNPNDNNNLKGLCTGIETHKEGPNRMSLFDIEIKRDMNNNIIGLDAKNLLPLHGYKDDIKQKNWIPLYIDNILCIVYDSSPIIILNVNDNGECSVKLQVDNTLYNNKNSTQFIPINYDNIDYYLTIVHVSGDSSKRRVYYHRFLLFDENFNLCKISDLFYFRSSNTIEFASSAIQHNNNLIIGYGYRDREAYITKISIDNIFNMLYDYSKYITQNIFTAYIINTNNSMNYKHILDTLGINNVIIINNMSNMFNMFNTHRELWKTIVSNNSKYNIILHDTCTINNNFTHELQELLSNVDLNKDMFHMGHKCHYIKENKLQTVEDMPLGLYAYGLTNSIAQWLIENIPQSDEDFDVNVRNMYYDPNIKRNWNSYVFHTDNINGLIKL